MYIQMQIAIGLAALNVLMLLCILLLSIRSYKKMPAEYTLFVILFTGLFLLQYAVGGWLYFTNMEVYNPSVNWHMLTLTALQTVAFAYMLWMEWQ